MFKENELMKRKKIQRDPSNQCFKFHQNQCSFLDVFFADRVDKVSLTWGVVLVFAQDSVAIAGT